MNIFGIKDSANFTVKYKSGVNKGKVFVYSDYATVATNEWTSSQVYAKSKNVNAIRWDYDRAGTLKADMEIFDLKWIGMLFGTEFVSGDKEVLKREALTVSEVESVKTATMVGTPVVGSMSVYMLDDDNLSNLKELVATTDYSISGNVITITNSEIQAGAKIAVFYLEVKTGAKTLTISADKYPDNFEVFADTAIRDLNGVDQFVQIHYLNVKPKSQFTLTLDAANITKLSIEFDILKDSASSDMAEYTIYE
jgi:hypothetical protein